MRAVNPYTKFFTADLYVENLETGNAFWGYHIANNFGRLMGVDGTLYFGTSTGPDATRIAEVDIKRLGLSSVPVVVHFSRTGDFYEAATAYFGTGSYAPQWGYTTGTYSDTAEVLWTLVASPNQPYHPGGGPGGPDSITIRIGDSTELMHVNAPAFGIPLPGDVWLLRWDVTRGYGNTARFEYSYGSSISFLYDWQYTIGTNITQNHWQGNSPHVQCTIADGYLRFRWMHSSAGTVYFKLFGA